MSLADFTIEIHDARKPMACRVVVHETVQELRKEAQKQYNTIDMGKERQPLDHLDDTLGVCHRFHMAGDPVVALIRLAPPHIGAGIVAHECAHAATHIWEVQHMWDKPLESDDDEWFCWILGELVSQTTRMLYEKEIY